MSTGLHSQHFHVVQTPESPIHEARDTVPLDLQRAQAVQPVERQTLDAPHAVPAQLPVNHKHKSQGQARVRTDGTRRTRASALTGAAGGAAGRSWAGWSSGGFC